MTKDIEEIEHSNGIPLNETINEINLHLDDVRNVFMTDLSDAELLKLIKEEAKSTASRFAKILYDRKMTARIKAPKTNPDRVPKWWGHEENRPMNKLNVRGTPNVFLRSGLFSIDKDDNRDLLAEEIKTAVPYSIKYTGKRLHQFDLDLWQTVVHFARGLCFGKKFIMTRSDIYEILNRSQSGKSIAKIEERLNILATCKLEIWDMRSGELIFDTSLIESFVKKKGQTIEYHIIIGEAMSQWFRYDKFTHINWELREKLNSHVAKWLHGYISTHAKVYAHTISYIKMLCGSRAKEDWRFKDTLLPALKELSEKYTHSNMFFGYSLTTKRVRKITRSGQINKVIRLAVPKQLLSIKHQPSEIQLVSTFIRQYEKNNVTTETKVATS